METGKLLEENLIWIERLLMRTTRFNPQWIVIEFEQAIPINVVRLAWPSRSRRAINFNTEF